MKDIQKQIQELEVELKKNNNKREYIRMKAIILKLKGNSAKSISEKLDVGKSTVFAWLKACREDSVNALKNKKDKAIIEIFPLKKKKNPKTI